jgi:hypothetical protein
MAGFKTILGLLFVIAASTGQAPGTCTINSNGFLGVDSGSMRWVGFNYDLTLTAGTDPNTVIPVLARAFIQELARDLIVLCGGKVENGITGFQTGGRDTVVTGATSTTCQPSQTTNCVQVHCNMTVYVKESSLFLLGKMNETMQLKSKANVFNSTISSQIVSVRVDDKSWKFETLATTSPPSSSIPATPTPNIPGTTGAPALPATPAPVLLATPAPVLLATPAPTPAAPTAPALTVPTAPKTPTTNAGSAPAAPTAPTLTTPTPITQAKTPTTTSAAKEPAPANASPTLTDASSPTLSQDGTPTTSGSKESTNTGKKNTTTIIIICVVIALVVLGVAFYCYRRYQRSRGAPISSSDKKDDFSDEESDSS